MRSFDVCIIGGGPAGYAACMRAIDFGKRVCLINYGHLGGAGIMHGAMTSKTMWELSKDYAVAAQVNRGYRASGLTVDYEAVRNTVISAAKEKIYQMYSQIETYGGETSQNKQGSIDYIKGWARFVDKNTVVVETEDGETEDIGADYFVIATGSRPRTLPDVTTDQKQIIDSDGILNLDDFPPRMMIIGAGIVGCEFATIFSNFGQTEVHMLDRADRVIPFEDDDLSDFVAKALEDNGVLIHHKAKLNAIRHNGESLEIVLDYAAGNSRVFEVDVALISIGRVNNLSNLGLENIGITPSPRGEIEVDDHCRVADNIYAVGDITGNAALVNVAELEGRYAAKGMYAKTEHELNYDNMSTIMFFRPEVAAVGMNEKQCREQRIAYKVAWYSNALVNRAISMRSTRGFVKILIEDKPNGKILGMRAAGAQASSCIMNIALLIDQNATLETLMKTIHPHPSITEGIQECFRLFEGKSIYKPEAFPDMMGVSAWKPE